MPRSIDSFVVPIPTRKVAEYRRLALACARIWLDAGALAYREFVGDDLGTECGVPFPRLARLRKGETVVVAFITYRSRAHRDRVNAKAMQDPRFARIMAKGLPFAHERMTHGGFAVLVDVAQRRPRASRRALR